MNMLWIFQINVHPQTYAMQDEFICVGIGIGMQLINNLWCHVGSEVSKNVCF